MATDIIVSEMTSATQINTNDLMIMTQPDLQAETGYSTKKGTVLQVANKMLKGTEYLTDLPDFTDKTVLGGLEELKGDLTALLPVNTASGAIANFDTDLTMPLVDCKANIVATGGNGTPDNPIPINGYSSANITRCCVNLWDEELENGQINANTGAKEPTTANRARSVNYIPIKATSTYYCYSKENVNVYAFFYDANKDYIGYVANPIKNSNFTPKDLPNAKVGGDTFDNACFMLFRYDDQSFIIGDCSINYPATDTTYHAYNGQTYTIAFGQTVYGGVLDVARGKLHVTHSYVNMGNISWIAMSGDRWETSDLVSGILKPASNNGVIPLVCSILVATSTNNLFTNPDAIGIAVPTNGRLQCRTGDIVNTPTGDLVYPLATPFDIDLTPVQINALMGVNNVYNDTNGDTEVKYKEGIQHYIDKKIAATQALIL